MEIDFGGSIDGSSKALTGFRMDEDTSEGLQQSVDIEVWVEDVDSVAERQRYAKQEALEMLRRAVATLEEDLSE